MSKPIHRARLDGARRIGQAIAQVQEQRLREAAAASILAMRKTAPVRGSSQLAAARRAGHA